MTLVTKERKTVFLLSPQQILTDHVVLTSLHITKSKTGTAYADNELDSAELNKFYATIPKPAKDVIVQLSKAGITNFKEEIKKKYNTQRAGLAFESYYRSSIKRRIFDLLESLKPYAGLVSWYHRIKSGKSNYKTAPCIFSTFKPQLQFEVTQENNLLHLEVVIVVNGKHYRYDSFNRYEFLLESRNEYFLLSYKDYQTLDLLQQDDASIFSGNPTEFARQVLAPLETDYTVNRNNLLVKTEIDVMPGNRVLLSEISGKFLVFTPQWLYDGFLVEGSWKATQEFIRNGDAYLVKRHRETEEAFMKMLEALHDKFRNQMNGYYYLSFEDAQRKQWFLKVYHHLLEQDIQVAGMDMLQHFRYSSHKILLETSIQKSDSRLVTMQAKVSFGKEEIQLAELQKLILAGQRSVLLKDGSIGILNDEWLQQYGVLFRHGKMLEKKIQIPKWFAFSGDSSKDNGLLKTTLTAGWWDKWRLWQQHTDQLFELPASINASLRPYQLKGYEWLRLLAEAGAGACLADDMGLGKTLQAICFLAYQLEAHPGSRHLIVCPTSLIYNWQQEILKFTPAITTYVHHGAGRSECLKEEKYDITITSYGTLRSDIEWMSSVPYGTIVLDESHNIKNPAAQITKAVSLLQANTRIALSGTPVMNNTFDLFAQLNFILPGMFVNREFFKREYADGIDRDKDPDKMLALKKLTAPFILRRTKQQVATDLPEKNEMIMWCTMSPAQKALYDDIKTSIRDSIFLNIKNEGFNKSKLAILKGMLRLRQLCDSPLLLPVEDQYGCTDSVKTDLLINELANNLKDHKVLVFSQFTGMLKLLTKACREQGIAHYHFDGQTPPAKRAEMVTSFQQQDDRTNVFFISLKAGNTGLNLTAADYVFLFDPWWNTAVQQQAIDRTHRIGQTKNVFAYKMICKDTIEEKIIEIQERKRKLAADLVSEDQGLVSSLTEEEIAYLFS